MINQLIQLLKSAGVEQSHITLIPSNAQQQEQIAIINKVTALPKNASEAEKQLHQALSQPLIISAQQGQLEAQLTEQLKSFAEGYTQAVEAYSTMPNVVKQLQAATQKANKGSKPSTASKANAASQSPSNVSRKPQPEPSAPKQESSGQTSILDLDSLFVASEGN